MVGETPISKLEIIESKSTSLYSKYFIGKA